MCDNHYVREYYINIIFYYCIKILIMWKSNITQYIILTYKCNETLVLYFLNYIIRNVWIQFNIFIHFHFFI